MPTTVYSHAATHAGAQLDPIEIELDDPGPSEVLIAITHSGVCYSDIDVIDDVFGVARFPAVAGHEIVGTIAKIGSDVKHLTVGQRVGVGPQCAACLRCELCLDGFENVCATGSLMTANRGSGGGFATHIQLGTDFVFTIPDGLDSAHAAPLLCAGLTTYSALQQHLDRPARVGILGIGGLGHLAVQFANKLGHDVTALALHPSAEEVAAHLALGASRTINTGDSAALRASERMDFILCTAHGSFELAPFVKALRPNGVLCLVGNTPAPIGNVAKYLVLGQRCIVGSAAGNRSSMRAMLEFAARQKITPMIERMPMSQINDALARVRANDVRFRMVLETS